MTDKSISITVPLERSAIARTIDFFKGLASDLETDRFRPDHPSEMAALDPVAPATAPGGDINPFAGDAPPATAPGGDINPFAGDAPPVTGVELDRAGLPHDTRIHGAKRLKTAKDGTWKKRRGVDPDLVATVEAELRAAMGATPAAPVTPAPATAPAAPVTPAPAPVEPVEPVEPAALEIRYLVEGDAFTAEQLKKSGWTDAQIATCETVSVEAPAEVTFPDLMKRITAAVAAGDLADSDITAAINAQGLASLPLLAARPDLIPAVYATLF
jgi:hypothetical protein